MNPEKLLWHAKQCSATSKQVQSASTDAALNHLRFALDSLIDYLESQAAPREPDVFLYSSPRTNGETLTSALQADPPSPPVAATCHEGTVPWGAEWFWCNECGAFWSKTTGWRLPRKART